MAACSTGSIDGETINVDQSSMIYTYKDTGEKVTGTVAFYELEPKTAKRYKSAVRGLKDGKRVNVGYDYFPNGAIAAEYPYQNGLVNGTARYYYDNGQLYLTVEFKDDNEEGIAREFNSRGVQTKEIIFSDGKKLKEYDVDTNGNRIIPSVEKLELLIYKTGFFEYRDLVHYELLYQPMVIMKWKNISSEPITETIQIEGVFISKDEELSKATDYFQGYSDPPLQVGLSRQSVVQSSVGYTNASGIYGADISCQIFVNKQLYKTVRIKKDFLTSNRIQ